MSTATTSVRAQPPRAADRLGCFYLIAKPMFVAMNWLFRYFGNFGVATLLIAIIIKIVFFPLANKAYASLAARRCCE